MSVLNEVQKRFVELRSESISMEEIGKELDISQEKLLDWNRLFSKEITNLIKEKAQERRRGEKKDLADLESELNDIDVDIFK